MSKPFAFWVQLATVVSMSTVVSLKPFQPSTWESQRSLTSSTGLSHRFGRFTDFQTSASRLQDREGRPRDAAMRLDWCWAAFLQREQVGSWIAVDRSLDGSHDGSLRGTAAADAMALATGSWVVGLESRPLQSVDVEGVIAESEVWDLFGNPGLPGVSGPEFDDPLAQGRAETVDELFGGPAIASSRTMASAQEAQSTSEAVRPEVTGSQGRFIATHSDGGGDRVDSQRFPGAEMRSWSDNTGNYRVVARVSMIFEDRVRLVKENGRTTTVPMRRLSEADLQYVKWVARSIATQSSASEFRSFGLEN